MPSAPSRCSRGRHPDARLLDAVAAGQKVWRLRVGPVASDRVAELSATVAGLGFGRPNIVRD